MSKQLKIVNNLLPNEYKNEIQRILLGMHFPWFWCEQTVEKEDGLQQNIFQLAHLFYVDNQINSAHFGLIEPMLQYIQKETNVKAKNIFRIKANLLPRQIYNGEDVINAIHMDVDNDNYTSCIYYLHDVDGDINMYDKNYNVVDSYSPKENSLVYFNSRILHGTKPPIQTKRRVCINFVISNHD